MRVALVHDYIKEFGGAERVLRELSDMYPDAPIYTAFVDRGSYVAREFSDRDIRESKWGALLKIWRLYSPLRFLLPYVWRSIDLSSYDLVITSSSNYIARGFKKGEKTRVVCYCHTPPRWLYGYSTPTGYRNRWWGKLYAFLFNPFIRYFDYRSAQEVDTWISNSENVRRRIEKFYRREAEVVYPPVDVKRFVEGSKGVKRGGYHLVVSRMVGAKGIEDAVDIALKLRLEIKIVGEEHGRVDLRDKIERSEGRVEVLGRVSDEDLPKIYAGAESLWVLAKDEDFGITPVEAIACGTPVVAYRGGGYVESVKEGLSGVFIDDVSTSQVNGAIDRIKSTKWDKKKMQESVSKFSSEEFRKRIKELV